MCSLLTFRHIAHAWFGFTVQVAPLEISIDFSLIDRLIGLSGRLTDVFQPFTVVPSTPHAKTLPHSLSRTFSTDSLDSEHSDGLWSAAVGGHHNKTVSPMKTGKFVSSNLRMSGSAAPHEAIHTNSVLDIMETPEAMAPSLPWYFEQLTIRRTVIRVTNSAPSGKVPGILAYFVTVQGAPLEIDALQLTDVLLPMPKLMEILESHYTRSLTKATNVFRVLLGSRLLIAPRTLWFALDSGMSEAYTEFTKALSDVRVSLPVPFT